MLRKCDYCGKEYNAKESDLKRGWGLCCSKSCAAKKRVKGKPSWNAIADNNIRRKDYNEDYTNEEDGNWGAHQCNCKPRTKFDEEWETCADRDAKGLGKEFCS